MKINGKTIALRTANVCDAEFILELRTQSDKTQFFSQVENDLAKQQDWLQAYKLKEQKGEEYYFVIELKTGEPLGLVRVYDLQPDSFCWGIWLKKRRTTNHGNRICFIDLRIWVWAIRLQKSPF